MKEQGSLWQWQLLGILFKAHPWHGVAIGKKQPDVITTYIEIVPKDTIKYELDKYSGLLMVDRPQAYSNICPTLYGLVPQTICRERVAEFCMEKTGREGIVGDDDPLDICVLTEKEIPKGDLLLEAVPIGGLRMIDGGEADDKIIAVLKDDALYGSWRDIDDCPQSMIDRLMHYFLTYKNAPGAEESACEITDVYGRDEAHEVIRRSHADYMDHFANIEQLLDAALNK
jgi:inorganic pyrophosphatase